MSSSPTPRRDPPAAAARRRWLRGPRLAAAAALVCYAGSLPNQFTYDDVPMVRDNPRIRALTDWRAVWLRDWWAGTYGPDQIDDPARDRLYRPLTLQTFALNYALHALNPLGYHLANLLLHAGVCVLLWHFARRVFGDEPVASVAALLFAVHPLHAEAVAGVVGRAELLAASFLLAGLVLLLPARVEPAARAAPGNGAVSLSARPVARPAAIRSALAAFAFLAALLSKETAICYPAVVLLTLHVVHGRQPLRFWAVHGLWLLLPLVVYFPLRFAALDQQLIRDRLTSILMNPMYDAAGFERLHGPLTILGRYVALLIVPGRLSCDYGQAIFDPHAGPNAYTLLGLATLATLAVGLWGYASGGVRRQLAYLAALFVASYVLISNAFLLIGVSLAERLMYWPSLPACVAIGLGGVRLWRWRCAAGCGWAEHARLIRAAGVLLLAALALRAVVRSVDWHDNEALLAADVASYPQGAHLNASLARVRMEQAEAAGDARARAALLAEAARLLERALRTAPRYPEALRNRGLVHLMLGQREPGVACLERALQLNPSDVVARRQLAALGAQDAELQQRLTALQQVVAQRPDDVPPRLELSRLLIQLGQPRAALETLEPAHQQAPQKLDVLRAYADALLVNGLHKPAREVLLRVVERDPSDWQAHTNLAQLLAEDDPPAALRHALEASRLQPDDLRTRINLAGAYAANRRNDEALQVLREVERGLPPGDPLRAIVGERIRALQRQP